MRNKLSAPPTAEDISLAYKRIKSYIHETPVFTSELINRQIGNQLFFKCENMQKAGAFKSRGVFNALLQLSDEEKKQGIITHSSGNHAQALARAAGLLGIKAIIVMPSNAPQIKKDAVRDYGAEIHFCEPTLNARESTVRQLIEKTGATEIHPYNNYEVITGQATCLYEETSKDINYDYILAPVGGGGLLSGTALTASYYMPRTKVLGCEPDKADDAYRSFISRNLIPSVNPNTIADGLLTSLGDKTFPIIIDHVDSILTVSEEIIVKAMRLIWERMKLVIEPSSAVPLAVLLEKKLQVKEQNILIILSGGNVDLTKLPWNQNK
ncbi:MAG: pyridoxal-phosphate dependent enzyme [Sphingobacteriia bacterium]|nr:pyridoxal-phosphate dependent enzyme [Sphingobacteriia bacterium]